MNRLNFLADEPWDEVNDKERMRARWFGHPFGADVLHPERPVPEGGDPGIIARFDF